MIANVIMLSVAASLSNIHATIALTGWAICCTIQDLRREKA